MTHSAGSPTMKDVAKEAGVSLGTVSKVINGIPVGESYRQRVEAAIRKLGYHVNTYARGLKTNKTNCVALVMPSLRHPFFAHLTDALTDCLMHRGYRSLLMITDFDPEAEQKCFVMVRENKADGVIALTYSPELVVDDGLPVVTIDRHLGWHVPCVSSDNYGGGEMAAEKLYALGCRKLLFLRIGPEVQGEADRRGAGFEHRCRTLGVDYSCLVLNDRDTEAPFFQFLNDHICGGRLDYDGIFCSTDSVAVHMTDYLRAQGIDVPGQVQIIGYDGVADYVKRRLPCSTIEQPLALMAEAAVEILLDPDRVFRGKGAILPVRYLPGGTTREPLPDAPQF